jgi:predicted acylesterase/phospholipase RssA
MRTPKLPHVHMLSLDGGAVRGLMEVRLLMHLASALQEESKLPRQDVSESIADDKLAETFHIITGTSTGGIIGLALAQKGFSPKTLTTLDHFYSHDVKQVFKKSWLKKVIRTIGKQPVYLTISGILGTALAFAGIALGMKNLFATMPFISGWVLPPFLKSTTPEALMAWGLIGGLLIGTGIVQVYFDPSRAIGIYKAQYGSKELITKLNALLGSACIQQPASKTPEGINAVATKAAPLNLIPVYNLIDRHIQLVCSRPVNSTYCRFFEGMPLAQLAQATAAAPTFFDPVQITIKEPNDNGAQADVTLHFADGGLGCNNPTSLVFQSLLESFATHYNTRMVCWLNDAETRTPQTFNVQVAHSLMDFYAQVNYLNMGKERLSGWVQVYTAHLYETGIQCLEQGEGIVPHAPGLNDYTPLLELVQTRIIRDLKDSFTLVSVGSGNIQKALRSDDIMKWNLLNWVPGMIESFFDAQSQQASYSLERQLNYSFPTALHKSYFRFQPNLSDKDAAMDDVSNENLNHLEHIARSYYDNHRRMFQEAAHILIQNLKQNNQGPYHSGENQGISLTTTSP